MTEHSCDALRIVNSQNTHRAFQEKHPNLYFPSLGIKIIYQSEEMVMVTNDEFAVPITFCPFCGVKLVIQL